MEPATSEYKSRKRVEGIYPFQASLVYQDRPVSSSTLRVDRCLKRLTMTQPAE